MIVAVTVQDRAKGSPVHKSRMHSVQTVAATHKKGSVTSRLQWFDIVGWM